jgi:branched-chain amino acid transport system ATP-binding protein
MDHAPFRPSLFREYGIGYGQLELALALASNPRVLLLDEPASGLSPGERQRIAQIIKELSQDITLILIEHDMSVALALADQVAVLHRGSIILEGTPDEVGPGGLPWQGLSPCFQSMTSIPIMGIVMSFRG